LKSIRLFHGADAEISRLQTFLCDKILSESLVMAQTLPPSGNPHVLPTTGSGGKLASSKVFFMSFSFSFFHFFKFFFF